MPTVSELISGNISNAMTNMKTWGSLVFNAIDYKATGDGTTDDSGKINDAVTAASTNGGTVVFPPGTYRIASDLTVPSNVTLWFMNGAMLSADSGVTVTISGPIEAGLHQIFSGSGTVVIAKIKEVFAEWWGAKGDGIADDRTALNSAVSSLSNGGDIKFVGTYKISSNLTFPENVKLNFAESARFSVDSGVTLTINSAIEAGLYQIFDGGGTIAGKPRIEYVFPQWFGAKGDGASDDASPIQKALNFFSRIMFRSATYKIGTTITIPSNCYIYGNGATFYTKNAIPRMWYIPSTSQDVHIEKINCNGDAPDFTAFQVEGHRVWFDECTTFNVNIGIVSRGSRHYINKCDLRANVGILIETSAEVKSISDCVIAVSNIGIRITGGAGIRISNCDIMGGNHNLLVDPNSGVVASVVCENVFFDQGAQGCVRMVPTGTGVIVRCKFSNCWMSGSSGSRGVALGVNVKGIQFDSCDIYGNAADGIFIAGQGIIVSNCQIAGNGGSGVSVGGGTTDFVITGNIIGPTGDFGANVWGVFINSGASDRYVITGNMLKGNTAGAISDGGTGTNKVVANNVT